MLRISTGFWILVLLFICAGCGDGTPTLGNVQADAKGVVCQSLSAVRGALVGLTDVNSETPVAELRTRKQQVDTLVEALRRANEVLQNERITQFIATYGDLSRTVDSAGAAATLGQAATAVAGAANAGVVTLDQAIAAVPCLQ